LLITQEEVQMNELDHHYTTSFQEVEVATKKDNYKFEGVAAFVYQATMESDANNKTVTVVGPGIPGIVPLHRIYFGKNRIDHFFTINQQEADQAVQDGGLYEGVACYVASVPLQFQAGWKICVKCGSLGFSHLSDGVCATGGSHKLLSLGFPRYSLSFGDIPASNNTQSGWRYCKNCQSLWYGGSSDSGGVCPAGGKHTSDGSGNYTLAHDIKANLGVTKWKWCNKCQGLWQDQTGFVPSKSSVSVNNVCPAGGGHDGLGSFNYRLISSRSVQPTMVPLYRLYQQSQNDHFYTTDINERNHAINIGYKDEGIACYVYPVVTQPKMETITTFYGPVPFWRIFQESKPSSDEGLTLSKVFRYIGVGVVVIGSAFFFGSDKKKCQVRKPDGSIVFYFCEDGPPNF